MKKTKDEIIQELNESIQQLMQENSELKTSVEFLQDKMIFRYNEGYNNGLDDGADRFRNRMED
jgi:uncharacterized protein (DUF2164 family)